MEESSGGLADSEVIRAVLSGDVQAYGQLVERYRARLFGLAFPLSGDYDAAADLTQETLIAAYNALDRIRDPSAFPRWICGILRNKFRNLRRRNCAPTLSLDQLMEAGFDPPAADSAPAASEEDLRQVMQCVEALPGKYRETLILRYVEDLSYKEIAEFLGLPVTTVTTRLNAARKLLVKNAKGCGLF